MEDNYITEIEGPTGEVFGVNVSYNIGTTVDMGTNQEVMDIELISLIVSGLGEEIDIIDGISNYTKETIKDKIKAVAMKLKKEG